MFAIYLSSFLLFIFGTFTLLGIKSNLLVSQIIFFIISIGVFFAVRKLGNHFFRFNSNFLYWVFVGLLVLTYIIGVEAKGSRRWIDLYFFNFQVSEFFKIFFILRLADFFSINRLYAQQLKAFVRSLLLAAIPILIIFKQPDLATALTFIFIYVVLVFFSKIPKVYLINFAVLVFFILPLLFLTLKDYQKARIVGFMNPHVDQRGASYNMNQAIIAVGSGQFFGKGLGAGTQSGLHFLPENHTDFAFSSLVEQFGFVAGAVVILLYGIIAHNLIKKIVTYFYERNEEGRYKFLFTLGFFAYFIFQVLVNVGMNVGLLPIAGITLPLISYGGSSLVTWMIGLALLP